MDSRFRGNDELSGAHPDKIRTPMKTAREADTMTGTIALLTVVVFPLHGVTAGADFLH
jgi:hypothetical protein